MYSAVYDLLQGVVDYAGLFPPAKLPVQKVVGNYAEYLCCDERWMLGRLIIPLADLPTVPKLVSKLENLPTSSVWRLSCLLRSTESQQLRSDVQAILEFNEEYRALPKTSFLIDAVELSASDDDEIERIAAALPSQIETFIELPSDDENTESLIALVANQNSRHLRAKIRTGAVLCELIPPAQTVASFIASCAKHKVPFKATAGLHHPIRGEHPLSYEQHAERCTMHGFLNVLLATALLYDAPANDIALDMLLDANPDNFVASENGWRWRNQNITREQIQHMRSAGMISFGSCSFIEPFEDLRALNFELTPGGAAGM